MEAEVAREVGNADPLAAGMQPHYFSNFGTANAVEVLEGGEMSEFHVALASNQEERKERMAFD